MNIVIAIDSLKGSLSSVEAGNAIKQGILRIAPDANVKVLPLADGGEGTTIALSEGIGGTMQTIKVCGPLGESVSAQYCILSSTKPTSSLERIKKSNKIIPQSTAIIEISAAAGITLVPCEKLNPLKATTYGVGEMIKDAISKGCYRFVIGIGGSATNDCGLGMLQALGFEFKNTNGNLIPECSGVEALAEITEILKEKVLPELNECEFKIACDVTNPLCGEQGCSVIYGPQKGATPDMIQQMDEWIGKFFQLSKRINPNADSEFPGSGAAGGLGFAFKTFLNAELKPGIDLVLSETNLEHYIKDADLVFTGEGRLDGQTAMGKAPVGVAKLAKKYGKPVIALAGCVTPDAVKCHKQGIDAIFPILRSVCTLDEAMSTANASNNMSATAEEAFRLWLCATKSC